MAKNLSQKIEAAQEEKRQLEAHIKQLLHEQKERDRKDRNHRLCKRGGLMEKLLPDLAILTDVQFQTFVDKTLLTGFAEKILRGLVPPKSEAAAEPSGNAATAQGGAAATKPTETAARIEPAPAPKPTGTAQAVGANGSGVTAATARVAG